MISAKSNLTFDVLELSEHDFTLSWVSQIVSYTITLKFTIIIETIPRYIYFLRFLFS